MCFIPYKNKLCAKQRTSIADTDSVRIRKGNTELGDREMEWWICDDHPESVRDLIEILESEGETVTGIFSSPDEMIARLSSETETKRPQGIFLDIDFKQQGEGLDAAGRLRKIDPNIPVIFITAYPEKYAQMILLKYEHPFGYLTKPFSRRIVTLYLEKMKNRKTNDAYLTIQFKRKDYHIRLSSILFLESDRHVTRIVTGNGEYRTYERLSELSKRLDQDFAQCHKSFIINLKYVECFEGDFIHLVSGQEIPVSRSAKKRVKDAFFDYLDGDFH